MWLFLFRVAKLLLLLLVWLLIYCAWQVHDLAQKTSIVSPQPAEVAIVLGAAAWGDKPSPVFRERINHALNLYRNKTVKKIIFTGGTPKAGYATEAQVAQRFALQNGVPSHAILLDNASTSTVENLQNAIQIMQDNHLHTAIVISDPYHMARTASIAQNLNMPAQFSATPSSRYNHSTQQARWKFFLQESVTLMAYRVQHACESFINKIQHKDKP